MALRTPAFNDARTYPFVWLRALAEAAGLQAGVLNAGDFKVTAAAAGLQRVDVAAGTVLVKGTSGTPGTGLTQGLYLVVNDASIASAVTLAASHASLPRLDQIILRVRDTTSLGSTSDDAIPDVVTGAATAGATLDNRSGAGALPADAIRLADVLVPAASTAVAAGNIRDRRPWARGFRYQRTMTTNAAAGADYPTTGAYAQIIDDVNLGGRMEATGAPITASLSGAAVPSLANTLASIGLFVGGSDRGRHDAMLYSAGNQHIMEASWTIEALAAGSHLFSPRYGTNGGTLSLKADGAGARWLAFEIREQVQQNQRNQ